MGPQVAGRVTILWIRQQRKLGAMSVQSIVVESERWDMECHLSCEEVAQALVGGWATGTSAQLAYPLEQNCIGEWVLIVGCTYAPNITLEYPPFLKALDWDWMDRDSRGYWIELN